MSQPWRKSLGFDDPKTVDHNNKLHAVAWDAAQDARRVELLLWKAIGRPRPRSSVR
jgi:hypothetical protein